MSGASRTPMSVWLPARRKGRSAGTCSSPSKHGAVIQRHGARTSRAASISARVGRCPTVILPLSVTRRSVRCVCVHEEAHLGVRAGLLGVGEPGGETRADEARSATPARAQGRASHRVSGAEINPTTCTCQRRCRPRPPCDRGTRAHCLGRGVTSLVWSSSRPTWRTARLRWHLTASGDLTKPDGQRARTVPGRAMFKSPAREHGMVVHLCPAN